MLIGGDDPDGCLKSVSPARKASRQRPRHARRREVPEVISMPRSIQEILDHAELAKRFEDYDPAEGDLVPAEEYLLRRAALTRARSEREVVGAIAACCLYATPQVCHSDIAVEHLLK